MPLRNRVTPFGDLVTHPARGLFMGNRGILHDRQQRLGRRRWAHKAWIVCLTSYKAVRRPLMAPGRYTELFFTDEAVALAAGHRPCAYCRRPAYRAFLAAIDDVEVQLAPVLDARLHGERIDPRTRRQRIAAACLGDLPDGAMVVSRDAGADACLWWNGELFPWRFEGYGPAVSADLSATVCVLTPPTTLAALKGGYRPVLHPTCEA